MPNVCLYYKKDCLLLVESVTINDPIDSKIHEELVFLFAKAKPEIVYVTNCPNCSAMSYSLEKIFWENEVWVADAPENLIHFNGKRALVSYG